MKVFPLLKNVKKYVDFRLVGILSLVYLIFVIIYSSKNAYFRILHPKRVTLSWIDFYLYNLLDWFLVVIFMIFIAITTKYLIQKKTKFIYISLIHLFFSFFIGAFTIIISSWIENLRSLDNISISLNELFTSYIRLVDLHFLIYISLVTIIYMYYYFQKIQETRIHTLKLQDQLSKSHLKFLQSQMHPHFLFNTLNGIHSLMDINITKSKSMVVDLSDLLRSVLEKKDQNLIELQEELEILEKYIHIKKTRFSDQLSFHLNIDDDLENVLVPSMLIQPLVENATKHGYSDNHPSLEISISLYKKNKNLIVKVENTGKKIEDSLPELLKRGTGLNNINERLQTLFKKDFKLDIYNNSDKVITKISFPVKLSISEITEDYH